MKDKNNVQQQKAISSKLNTNVLVIAGPGTGKTRVLAKRADYLLTKNICASKIKVLAFTKDAANEIAERLDPSVGAGTFSSWCYKSLKHYSYIYKAKTLFDAEKAEQHQFVSKLINKQKLSTSAVINIISLCKNKQISINEAITQRYSYLARYEDKIEKLIQQYESTKEQEGIWDFDDLLTEFYQCIRQDTKFLATVKLSCDHLLVDEVQDMSIIQWKILHKLSKHNVKVFCVGDPAQLIYQFRGASARYLKYFKEKFSNSAQVKLLESYRSSVEITASTNWLRNVISPKYNTVKPIKGFYELPEYYQHHSMDNATTCLVKGVGQLLKDGEDANEIAILVRTNKQLEVIGEALDLARIPISQDSDKFGIRLMTMHSSKGREFEIVFVIDPRFNYTVLDTKATELRILYVALSRAKTKLKIYAATSGKSLYSEGKSSDRYPLDVMPEELTKFCI